jgi:hypothetical protein
LYCAAKGSSFSTMLFVADETLAPVVGAVVAALKKCLGSGGSAITSEWVTVAGLGGNAGEGRPA